MVTDNIEVSRIGTENIAGVKPSGRFRLFQRRSRNLVTLGQLDTAAAELIDDGRRGFDPLVYILARAGFKLPQIAHILNSDRRTVGSQLESSIEIASDRAVRGMAPDGGVPERLGWG